MKFLKKLVILLIFIIPFNFVICSCGLIFDEFDYKVDNDVYNNKIQLELSNAYTEYAILVDVSDVDGLHSKDEVFFVKTKENGIVTKYYVYDLNYGNYIEKTSTELEKDGYYLKKVICSNVDVFNGYEAYIYAKKQNIQRLFDKKNIFNEEQSIKLNDICNQIKYKYNLELYLVTCNRQIDRATIIGTDFMSEIEKSTNESISIIILNATTSVYNDYHFDIYTYGDCSRKFTDSEIDEIVWSDAGDSILLSTPNDAFSGLSDMAEMMGKYYAN